MKLKKRHEENRDGMSSSEFLSGFKKDDKLTPIIPITLYWGMDEWEAPTCLHEMLLELKDAKLSNETVSTINLFTGSDIKLNQEGEVTDVCLAIFYISILDKKSCSNRAYDVKYRHICTIGGLS